MGSVYNEIARIETAKSDIEMAIETCGVNVPNTALINAYASYIRQIPSAVFSGLNVDSTGGTDQYIQSIEQENGLIKTTLGGLVSTSSSGLVPKATTSNEVIDDGYVLTFNGDSVDWYKFPNFINWDNIIDKPDNFTPEEHEHPYLPLTGGTVNGDIYADAFYENSDLKLKQEIQSIVDCDNIPQIKKFSWISNGNCSYGLIAQDLEDLGYNELVNTSSNGLKRVNYSAALSLIIGKLHLKVQELEKEIEILKNIK